MVSVELSDIERLLALSHQWLAGVSARLWPGYSAARIPLVAYTPGRRALLFGHPAPPADFEPVTTELGEAALHEGAHPRLAANTSLDLGGIQTACVMTTSVPPSDSLVAEVLALVTHEAFHSFQNMGGFAGAMAVGAFMSYPADDPQNNALSQIENGLISEAQAVWPDPRALDIVVHYLAVRKHRLARLRPEHAEIEDRLDRFEGMAQYVALRALLDLLDGNLALTPELESEVEKRQSLAGQVGAWRASAAEFLRRCNTRGSGGVWPRTYLIGAFKGIVLDRLAPGWQEKVAAGAAPNALLEEALSAAAVAGGFDLASILAAHGYERRLANEEDYQREQEQKLAEALLRFDPSAQPVVTIDLFGQAGSGPFATEGHYGMDPLNTRQLPDGRRLHQRIYYLDRSDLRVSSQAIPPVPVLEDQASWRIAFPLPRDMALREDATSVSYSSDGFTVVVPRCQVIRTGQSYTLVV